MPGTTSCSTSRSRSSRCCRPCSANGGAMTDGVSITTAEGVLTITWNRPETLNSVNGPMLDAAAEAIETADEDVRLVVITGTGRAFCAGADLGNADRGTETLDGANRLVRAMTRSP